MDPITDSDPTEALELPESFDDCGFEYVSSDIWFTVSAPKFVSAEAYNGSEDFVFGANPVDSISADTSEPLRSMSYQIFDDNKDLIKESIVIDEIQERVYYLWDVEVDSLPYFGLFTYNITFNYDSGTVVGEGSGYAIACSQLEECCDEDILEAACIRLLGTEFGWGSNVINGSGQSNFAAVCCTR